MTQIRAGDQLDLSIRPDSVTVFGRDGARMQTLIGSTWSDQSIAAYRPWLHRDAHRRCCCARCTWRAFRHDLPPPALDQAERGACRPGWDDERHRRVRRDRSARRGYRGDRLCADRRAAAGRWHDGAATGPWRNQEPAGPLFATIILSPAPRRRRWSSAFPAIAAASIRPKTSRTGKASSGPVPMRATTTLLSEA